MKKQRRTSEERLTQAYEHAFLCLFVLSLLAFTALYLHILGILGHPRGELQSVGPLASISLWGACVTLLYVGLRKLFIHLTKPALGAAAEETYAKKVTL